MAMGLGCSRGNRSMKYVADQFSYIVYHTLADKSVLPERAPWT